MVYSFPPYITAIPIVIAIVAALVGMILLVKRKPVLYWLGAFAVAAVAGVIFAPMIALDRVVLDDEKLEQTTGFWFAPTVKGFRLADAFSVTIRNEPNRKGRETEVWIITMKSGQTQRIDPGDLWEMNGDDIAARLEEKGIIVVRE